MSTYTYPSECIRCGRSLQRSTRYGNQYVECSCTKIDVPTMTTLKQVPTVANMTPRVYLAGQALMAFQFINNPNNHAVNRPWDHEKIAKACLSVADAILAASEEKP